VASDFPDLHILIRHAGWPWVREAIAVAMRHKNVYLELSLFYDFPGVDDFVKAANVIVPDQVVYSSAYPVDPLSTLDKFKNLPFNEDVLPKVLYANACRFLGVPTT
jgi:predicted TIM-barrel fold metal-dependent hydrolase